MATDRIALRLSDDLAQKCGEIVLAIKDMCNVSEDAFVLFSHDWGDNTITVEINGKGHTHVGAPSEDYTFIQFIDSLHALLCKNTGLSFHHEEKS